MKPEKLTKTVGLLRPLDDTYTIQVGEGYNASVLGDLIVKRMKAQGKNEPYILTRDEWQEYVRGLVDAHVMDAARLFDMLTTHKRVEFSTEERPRS